MLPLPPKTRAKTLNSRQVHFKSRQKCSSFFVVCQMLHSMTLKYFQSILLKYPKHPCSNLAKNVSLNCLRHPTTTSSPASNQAQIQVSIYEKCLVRALSLQQSFFRLLYHFFLKCISKAFVRLGFPKPLSFRLRL